MVPKTGSRSLHLLAQCPGYVQYQRTRQNKTLADRQGTPNVVWMHSMAYRPCSIATLRDPCERIGSRFRHLKERYPPQRASQHWCKYSSTPACTTHWLHNATNLDSFVQLLGQHWPEIRDHNHMHEFSTKRHLVIAMPQSLWIGGWSRILCTPRITSELAPLARDIGACGTLDAPDCSCVSAKVTNRTDGRTATGTSDSRVGSAAGQRMGIDFSGRSYSYSQIDPEALALSPKRCAQTRQLYAGDAQLWTKLCGVR